jgi:hypothetical protein
MRQAKIILLTAFFTVLGSPAVLHAAVQDPDRESTTPTSWHWWRDRTEDQINTFRHNGERLIGLELSPSDAGKFDAVLVQNSGTYQRSDGWWFGFTHDQVVAKVAENNGRITDLRPYTVNGQRRFAFTLIRNEGDAAKSWWWNYDLTPQQVTNDINLHGIRLVDLDAYEVNGKTLYSYVGIKNQGVDSKAWWWYNNVSAQYVTDRINEFGARLTNIEVLANGNLAVVMEKNDGSHWWWGTGYSQDQMNEVVATTASRLVGLRSYVRSGQRLYAFICLDNANTETRRLRELIYQAYKNPKFGSSVIRGFLVKPVGGTALVDLAGDWPFQPLSTLKLLPYLYTMIEIDKGNATLADTSVSWTETTVDDPTTSDDERKYASCLVPGSPHTQPGSAKLKDALPTMMWESHNRTLDALMAKYPPAVLNPRALQLGLSQTQMYFGCPQPNGPSAPWAANRSTLYDLGKIFEGVETLQFVQKDSTRQAFLGNMIKLDYEGASYSSPITGKTTGPFNNFSLRAIVQREAGPAKQAIVEEFLRHVVLRGKGGSGGPSSDEFGYSDFLYETLPFKQNGQIVDKTFVLGWFIYKLKTPPGCPEAKAADNGPCQAIWQPEIDARERFRTELHTAAIRQALATW